MKKLALTTLAIFLAACSAENTTSNIEDNIAETAQEAKIAAKALAEKEAMAAREMAAKEKAQKEATAKALAEKEALAKESAAKELAAKEAAAKAALARETAANEAAAQEAAAKETARINAIKQEEAQQEALRQEALRQEAATQEAARQEALRQESLRQEAAKQEALRQEAAAQEAARQEAERQATAAQANRVLSSGTWSKKSFSVSGNWTLSTENGVTTVALDNAFKTKKAPDLKIFLSPLSPDQLNGGNATQGSLLVSPLSSNKGAQKYNIPAGTNLSQYKTILIHCEAFSKLWSVSAL